MVAIVFEFSRVHFRTILARHRALKTIEALYLPITPHPLGSRGAAQGGMGGTLGENLLKILVD